MNKSENIAKLAVALVKFNGEVSKIAKDANNPFFKNNYATLDNIVEEIRPALQRNGLSILQIPGGTGENIIMKTLLLHESGEWLESDELMMKPVKNDPQAVGSCITYARRYSLASFLSLNTGEDDDGNAATHKEQPKQKPQDAPQQPKAVQPVLQQVELAKNKLQHLQALRQQKGISDDQHKALLGKMGIDSSKHLSDKQYDYYVDWLNKRPDVEQHKQEVPA